MRSLEVTLESSARRPMWCDDFDMDLLKVIPEACDAARELDHIRLYTVCQGPTEGVLNLPAMWNSDRGFDCFFGMCRPGETPAEQPQPQHYVANGTIVVATVEETFRDLWSHGAAAYLCPGRDAQRRPTCFLDTFRLYDLFFRIMSDIRGQVRHFHNEVELAIHECLHEFHRAAGILKVEAEFRGIS